MLINHIDWVEEKVRVYRFDVDGSHDEIDFNVADALDLLGWLTQERHKIHRINEMQIRALQKEHVEERTS